MSKLEWHTCPVCQKRFKGGSRRVYCSRLCKMKFFNGARVLHKDESAWQYREALRRPWINPEPWAGKAADSFIYGNMVFL